jgi:hypothetical protein
MITKSRIGIGRGFYQTASQVAVQAAVSRPDMSVVVTAVLFALLN